MNNYNEIVTKIDKQLKEINSKISELEFDRICILMSKREVMMKNTTNIISKPIKELLDKNPNLLDGVDK